MLTSVKVALLRLTRLTTAKVISNHKDNVCSYPKSDNQIYNENQKLDNQVSYKRWSIFYRHFSNLLKLLLNYSTKKYQYHQASTCESTNLISNNNIINHRYTISWPLSIHYLKQLSCQSQQETKLINNICRDFRMRLSTAIYSTNLIVSGAFSRCNLKRTTSTEMFTRDMKSQATSSPLRLFAQI